MFPPITRLQSCNKILSFSRSKYKNAFVWQRRGGSQASCPAIAARLQASRLRTYVEDGPVAVSAARREDVVVVCLAVGLIVPLKEVLGAQFLVAVGAREVLGVPCAPQGRHHLQEGGERRKVQDAESV